MPVEKAGKNQALPHGPFEETGWKGEGPQPTRLKKECQEVMIGVFPGLISEEPASGFPEDNPGGKVWG